MDFTCHSCNVTFGQTNHLERHKLTKKHRHICSFSNYNETDELVNEVEPYYNYNVEIEELPAAAIVNHDMADQDDESEEFEEIEQNMNGFEEENVDIQVTFTIYNAISVSSIDLGLLVNNIQIYVLISWIYFVV